MAKLEAYDKALDYSYAPGIFPATECLKNAKKRCMRLLVSSNGLQSEGVQALERDAQEAGVRVEVADRALERISKKENCFAAMVYKKAEGRFDEDSPHIVLHHPSDSGNLGTILRTALGFGLKNIAIIRPAVDSDDPRVVRASMGAVFRMDIPAITEAEVLAQCAEKNLMLTVTALNDRAVDIRGADFRNAVAVIGSEGQGVRQSLLEAAAQSVIIPMQAHCESLNAAIAAAIVMWQMKNGEYGG